MAGLGSRGTTWGALRSTVVGELLSGALAALGPAPLRVVDAGGGTGGFAVPLAVAGHQVTVVDPSPDAMAALRRRVAEGGVTGAVQAVQGDLAGLLEVVPPGGADVVLCHNVLEVVDDAGAALAAVHAVLRPGGLASVLVPGRGAAVLTRVLAGRFAEAAELLDQNRDEQLPPRRYDVAGLHAALRAAQLLPEQTHGIRVFSDLVPGAILDSDPGAVAGLLALERAASERPEYLALAVQLHVLARRPAA